MAKKENQPVDVQMQKSIEIAQAQGEPDYPHGGRDPGTREYQAPSMGNEDRIIRHLHRNLNFSWDHWEQIYREARNDVSFAYQEQWDPDAKAERIAKNRPTVSPTLIPQYIHRVAGVARQSKFSIHIKQIGGPKEGATKTNGEKVSMSEVMEGMVRDIEARSQAPLKYSRALQHAVEGSIGWMRIRMMMGPHDPFSPEIMIEHVKDRQSVIMDHLAEDPLLRDANYGYIGKWMNLDDFNEKWPERHLSHNNVAAVQGDGFMEFDRWYNDNAVRVGEYYWKEPVTKTAIKLINAQSGDEMNVYEDEVKDVIDELEMLGYVEVKRLKHETYEVKWALVTGMELLEGPFTWPGKSVPLVPVIGRQVEIGGQSEYHSIHRYAKDSQRMYSYAASMALERIAMAPNAPWLADVNSISNVKEMWDEQNINARNVLLYNSADGVAPPQRIMGAEVPAAEIQLVGLFRQNLMESIGIYEASLGKKSNETSGVAIQQRQMAGEYGSMEFIDNLNYSIAALGDIICELIPKVYTERKMQRLIMADNTQTSIVLNEVIPNVDKRTGEVIAYHTINQIGLSRFASTSVSGPGFQSQRQEFVQMMTEITKNNPEIMGPAIDLLIKSMDFPGSKMLERRIKATLPRHVLTEEESKDLPPPQPTPEQELQMKQMEVEQMKIEADMKMAEVEMMRAQADMESTANKVRVSELSVDEKRAMLSQERVELQKKQLELEAGGGEGEGESEEGIDEEQLERKIKSIVKEVVAEMNVVNKQKETNQK